MLDGKEKTKFRASVKWKKFRFGFIKDCNSTCPHCNTKYYGKRKRLLQLHHLDPERYTNLVPEHFRLLCSSCHSEVERLVTKVQGDSFTPPHNWREWMALYRDLLPYYVRERAESFI